MNKVDYLEIKQMGNSNIPVLHVVIKDNSEEIVREGWLSPFRAYSFQVSGTDDGQCDCGASSVIGLKHCITLSCGDGIGYQSNLDMIGVSKQLLFGQALIALTKWTSSEADLGDWVIRNYPQKNQISKFIDNCYDWLKSI